jgi:hypothetical protein
MPYLTAPRALLLWAVALATACSATGTGSSQLGPSSSASGSGAGGGGTGTGGTGGAPLFDAGDRDALPDPDASCGLITVQAHATPVDLYIAIDKSSSMAGTKWNGAKSGLDAFLNDPSSAGIRVALNFFPLDNNPTCDQFQYEPPVVAFGLLPANAAALTAAMSAQSPNGFSSPVYPALGGAILAGIAEAQNNPGDAAAVLLVTDGQPDGPATNCGSVDPNDPAAIAALAMKGATFNPPVKTFVVGLPGVNVAIANQIAAAGGTGSAILVTVTNIQVEFQNALAKVRGQAVPCEYDIPSQVVGGQVDPQHVNVLVTPGGGKAAILPQDPTCASAGWRYDDPSHPGHIELCPASCTTLKADLNAEVQILLGCTTDVLK